MVSDLAKILSKRDIGLLLNASYDLLVNNNKEDLSSVIFKLQNLLALESILLSYGYGSPENVKLKDGIVQGFSTEYLTVFMANKYYRIDPIIKRAIITGEFVGIDEHLKRNPTDEYNSSVIWAKEFGFATGGFIYILRDMDNSSFMSFSAIDPYGKLEKRLQIVIKYITPFFEIFFEKLVKGSQKPIFQTLSRRETEILKWLKEGKSSWEISMILNIGECTVNFHVTNIMRKLNVTRRTQAVAVAVQNKLIEF